MAKLEYLIPIGLLKKSRKFIPGHFEFKKIIGDILKAFNVPFQDSCCDNLNNGAPVRYNPGLARLEYYDATTDAWIDVPTP